MQSHPRVLHRGKLGIGESGERLAVRVPKFPPVSVSNLCDFCRATHAPVLFKADDFAEHFEPLPGMGFDYVSLDEWRACEPCALLVTFGLWELLTERAVFSFVQREIEDGRNPDPFQRMKYRQVVSQLYKVLRGHLKRTG